MTSTGILARLAARLDVFTAWVGRIVAYLCVATVLICFANVYLRYALGVGFVWLQESYIWTHCAAIMFGSSYAILQGGFVRVDMFYNRMSARGKAWVDLFGTIAFLAPFLLMMMFSGWSFFLASWKMNERSAYESGLSGVYLLKGTILIFAFLVGVQALAIMLRSVLTLLDRAPAAKPAGSPERT
ncbi:MAG: TRAP transporter small permease subunit [Rhodospirillales bacterium]|nr:TRAP transporter small permease subunit [Rhodospirillales bacterium]